MTWYSSIPGAEVGVQQSEVFHVITEELWVSTYTRTLLALESVSVSNGINFKTVLFYEIIKYFIQKVDTVNNKYEPKKENIFFLKTVLFKFFYLLLRNTDMNMTSVFSHPRISEHFCIHYLCPENCLPWRRQSFKFNKAMLQYFNYK